MSAETPGSRDALPPQPSEGEVVTANPAGYPPAGQAEHLAALAAAEAASQPSNVEGQLENDLAALDAGTETPEARRERLTQFVSANFADICPKCFVPQATVRFEIWEDQCRDLFDEPDLELGEEDIADPELKTEIENTVEIAKQDQSIAARTEIVETKEASVATNDTEVIPRNTVEIDDQTAIGERERRGLAEDKDRTAGYREDLETVKDLQGEFERLKAQHGTVGALQLLLDPETGVKSPEMRAIVQRAVNTAQAVMSALPGKEAVVSRLLDASQLNLAGGNSAAMFTGFLSAVDGSEDLTEAEKVKLRQVLNQHDDIEHASDLKDALAEGRETITHPDGTTETVGYDEDHPLETGNLAVYPDGDMMRGTANFDGLRLPFKAPLNTPSSALNQALNASVYTVINEAAGVTGGTNQGFEVTQMAKEIDLVDGGIENQATREAKLAIENMTDTFDISAGLLDQTAIRQLQWGHQWFLSPRDPGGDAGFGDNDERARAEQLGGRGHDGLLWDGNDQLKEANFIAACRFIRERARTGMSEPDLQALIDHVHLMNGKADEIERAA